MPIDFQHPDYTKNYPKWELTEHTCKANEVEKYLITLNKLDTSSENVERNKNYKDRAVFYPVVGHTLEGMIGLIFSKYPEVELPAPLDYALSNCDGSGVSIYQQSQIASAEIIQKGRAGLFVSYPKTTGPVSVADMAQGGFIATIHLIEAEQILNWRTELKGSQSVLTLVVIKESVEVVQADGYEIKMVDQIRELAIVDGIFIVREWRKNDKDEWIVFAESTPTDARGTPWTEIPFVFLGAVSNTPEVNDPPLYPLAKINIAHYRNSADYEDSVWYVGQAQPWMSGITQTHVDLMRENKMYVGSRNLLGVPGGETFAFASADPNPLVRQAMLDKLEMMVGLGARFIQGNGQAKTATEARNDAAVQHSSLSLVSSNISEGYTQALAYAAQYMGADGEIVFQTSMDFVSPTATAQDIQAMVAGFIQGAIPMSDYFRWLKKVDLVESEKTVEQFSEELSTVQMPALDQTKDNQTP